MKEKAIGKIIVGLLICLMIVSVFGGIIDATSATNEKTTVSVTESSPWFTKGSNSGHPELWYSQTYQGHNYISTYVGGMSSNPSQPDCWAKFKPYLSQSGKYEVYAYLYACKDTSTKVPFTVKYDGGSTTIKVNQYISSPAWKEKYLGTWNFKAGADTCVKVTDATGDPYDGCKGLTIGAIKFMKKETVPTPVITGIDPSQPTASPTRQWITIIGTGFVSDSTVTLRIGSSTYPIPADRTEFKSSTQIRVYVGLTDPGTWSARVTNPGNRLSNLFSFTVKQGIPSSVHDMTVTNVYTTPSSPNVGQTTTIYVTVKNEGNQQEKNVPVKAYVDAYQVGSAQYVTLSAGKSTTKSFIWTPSTAKTYSVKGEVEIVNGEIDVKDNTKSIKVRVSAVPTPTATPTLSSSLSLEPKVSQSVMIGVKRSTYGSGQIETLDLENQYLPVVVACENGNAPYESMKAQAVAARTFAMYKKNHPRSEDFDIYDDQRDQVYNPSVTVTNQHRQSVTDTNEVVLEYTGDYHTIICAFYVSGTGSTAQYVTYNEGKSGNDITQTSLGYTTNPPSRFPDNRGCMGQVQANNLASSNSYNYLQILKYFYGSDIEGLGGSNGGTIYDRQAAYNYAQKYGNKVCSDGCFWDQSYPPTCSLTPGAPLGSREKSGYDCAHFASCCIGNEPNEKGGGLNVDTRVPPAYGEPGAHRLRNWLLTNGVAEGVSSIGQLEKGDVIFFDLNKDRRFDHSVLYLGNGKIAAHSRSYWNVNWDIYNPSENHYEFIHIKSADKKPDLVNPAPIIPSATLSVSPKEVSVGDPITIKVDGKDDTNVKYLSAYYSGNWHRHECTGIQTHCGYSWTTSESSPGSYKYYGYIKDNEGNGAWSTPKYIEVTVNPSSSPPSATLSVSPKEVSVGDPITIKVDGKDDTNVKYLSAYYSGNWHRHECIGIQTHCGYSWTTSESSPGSYKYYGYIKDNEGNGAWSTPKYIEVTVNPSSSPPSATLSVSPKEVSVGDPITIKVDGKDDTDVKYLSAYYSGNWHRHECTGIQTHCGYSWTTSESSPGSYKYYGYIKDNEGNGAWSTPKYIEVTFKS